MTKLSTICYIDNGEALLMLHRNKKDQDIHQGKWVSVGGKFEIGETPEECARREIFEETGLHADNMDLLGFITFPNFTQDGEDWYSFVFKVNEFHGELIAECDEGTLKWVPYDQVMDLPTWTGDYIFLDWVLNGRPFFSAKFVYDAKGDLTEHHVDFYEDMKGGTQ